MKKSPTVFAKQLVEISKEGGRVSEARVRAILQVLEEQDRPHLSQFLRTYAFYLQLELQRSEASVESAVPLSATAQAELEGRLSAYYGRPIQLKVTENKALLGGLRVRVADDVFDNNILNKLTLL
ncbi:MAG: hypothetical protein A2Y14_01160 [Verrucomicrobia bacterium GWF2_51_19]|nr:MAG: hypothetical protein A2Y14_01160 [Verrucomicrobia bacterium GWF2_51_19]HCJ12602.1 hypothetical protein [Opitutae bacterium]